MRATVFETMTSKLTTCHLNESLDQAFVRMRNDNVRHLPVRDDSGKIVGIISDRDFQRAMKPDSVLDPMRKKPLFSPDAVVGDYMNWPVKVVSADADLRTVAKVMMDEKVSALLVTNFDEVLGIVTHEDLLRLLVHLLEQPEKEGIGKKMKALAYNSPIGHILNTLNNAGI